MVVTRMEFRRRVNWPKRLFWLLLILLFAASLICTALSIFVGWKMTHKPKKALSDTPVHYQLTYQDIAFESRKQDVNLKGWYLPPVHSAAAGTAPLTVVLAHGYGQNRLQVDVPALPIAKSLVEAGYGVVMFDFRDSGESGGTLTSIGEFEEQDLLAAVDWVQANHPGKVGLIGFSMGATTSLLAAADDPNVVGVIADSPFNHLGHYLQQNLPVWSHLPNIPFTPLILNLLPSLIGVDPDKVDALAAVDRIYPRPVLFIHSVDDQDIPYTNSEAMWEKHPDKFSFWKTAKAGHVGSYKLYSEEYTNRMLDFIKTW